MRRATASAQDDDAAVETLANCLRRIEIDDSLKREAAKIVLDGDAEAAEERLKARGLDPNLCISVVETLEIKLSQMKAEAEIAAVKERAAAAEAKIAAVKERAAAAEERAAAVEERAAAVEERVAAVEERVAKAEADKKFWNLDPDEINRRFDLHFKRQMAAMLGKKRATGAQVPSADDLIEDACGGGNNDEFTHLLLASTSVDRESLAERSSLPSTTSQDTMSHAKFPETSRNISQLDLPTPQSNEVDALEEAAAIWKAGKELAWEFAGVARRFQTLDAEDEEQKEISCEHRRKQELTQLLDALAQSKRRSERISDSTQASEKKSIDDAITKIVQGRRASHEKRMAHISEVKKMQPLVQVVLSRMLKVLNPRVEITQKMTAIPLLSCCIGRGIHGKTDHCFVRRNGSENPLAVCETKMTYHSIALAMYHQSLFELAGICEGKNDTFVRGVVTTNLSVFVLATADTDPLGSVTARTETAASASATLRPRSAPVSAAPTSVTGEESDRISVQDWENDSFPSVGAPADSTAGQTWQVKICATADAFKIAQLVRYLSELVLQNGTVASEGGAGNAEPAERGCEGDDKEDGGDDHHSTWYGNTRGEAHKELYSSSMSTPSTSEDYRSRAIDSRATMSSYDKVRSWLAGGEIY